MRCPACKELMFAGTTVCKACGYDLDDRHRARPRRRSRAIFIVAAAVFVVGLALVLHAELAHRPKAQKSRAALILAAADSSDRSSRSGTPAASVGAGGGRESLAAPAGPQTSQPAPGQALVNQYQGKIAGVQEELDRTRKRLNDSKRMTQKSQDILNKMESDLNGLKGTVNTLAATPTRGSENAIEAVIDNRLVEIRKQFGEIQ